MKYVEEMSEGDNFNGVLLVRSAASASTKKGDPYLALTLADKTGAIECRCWGRGDCPVNEGDFARVSATVGAYRGERQLTVTEIHKADREGLDVSRYVPASKRPADEMMDELLALADEHCDASTYELIEYVLTCDWMRRKRVLGAPAASRNHHAFAGGLVEHALSMAGLAVAVCEHYERQCPGVLDKSLVVAGAILHDIGKADEQDPVSGYTDDGKLLGHIFIGAELVGRAADAIAADISSERLRAIQHLILSHHGRKEWGSPVEPRTPEAHALHHIDMLDSRMGAIVPAVESCDGDWTEPVYSLGGALFVGEAH